MACRVECIHTYIRGDEMNLVFVYMEKRCMIMFLYLLTLLLVLLHVAKEFLLVKIKNTFLHSGRCDLVVPCDLRH